MSLEQVFPMLYGNKHGFVKSLDIKSFENRLKELNFLDKYFRVKFYDMERMPKEGGALVIGNHGPFGVDAPLLVKHVYEDLGRVVRPLGDRLVFKIPMFRVFLNSMGVLEGNAEQAIEVLEAGELCSVYPGGFKETVKSPKEKYEVRPFWQNHFGYIKVALRAGVPIVPVVNIGVDDALFQLRTADETSKFPPARIFQKVMKHNKYKIPLWMGIGLLPVPVSFNYQVGHPIDLGYGPEAAEDLEILEQLNEKIITIVEGMLDAGMEARDERRALRREKVRDGFKTAPRYLAHKVGFASKESVDDKILED